MVDRISSFTQTNTLNTNNLRLQSSYAQKQIQISSGQKSEGYQGIAKETPNVLSLETDYKKIVSQSENAQTALDRTEVIFDKFDSIIRVGQSFLDDLNAAISGLGTNSNQLITQATQNRDQVATLLNAKVANRFVFSGSAVKTSPVDLAAYTGTSPVVLPSVVNDTYYAGNDFIQSVELSEGFEIDYGVTANNPAFEKLIRAFDLVINNQSVTLPTIPKDALIEAYTLLQESLDELEVVKATTSQTSQALSRFVDDSLSELNLIDSLIANLKEVDLAETTVRLQELQAQLEASYAVTTKLLDLKLSDFLR